MNIAEYVNQSGRSVPVMFALSDAVDSTDDYVIKRGLLFVAGNFPEVGYSMTPEEIAAAASSFVGPVDLDDTHHGSDTVFAGRLGQLLSVEAVNGGRQLLGTVRLPRMVDALLGGMSAVSCAWDRASKTLTGLSLCQRGRVAGAAIFTAGASVADRGQALAMTSAAFAAAGLSSSPETGTPVPEGGEPWDKVRQLVMRTSLGEAQYTPEERAAAVDLRGTPEYENAQNASAAGHADRERQLSERLRRGLP
jgi:hypothetical protein